ncbi:MAG TPA: hypothetical protein V6C58_04600 [Allocoleopsis sp.]
MIIEYKEKLDGRLLRIDFEEGSGIGYRFEESYLAQRIRLLNEEPDKNMALGSDCDNIIISCPFYVNGRCTK